MFLQNNVLSSGLQHLDDYCTIWHVFAKLLFYRQNYSTWI